MSPVPGSSLGAQQGAIAPPGALNALPQLPRLLRRTRVACVGTAPLWPQAWCLTSIVPTVSNKRTVCTATPDSRLALLDRDGSSGASTSSRTRHWQQRAPLTRRQRPSNGTNSNADQQQLSSNVQQLGALPVLGLAVAAQFAAWLTLPAAAHASESLSSSLLDVFRQFLEQIQALGPWGAVLFITTVSLAEMVPLFPTQPLSLASGLLFGAKQGALFMLIGVTFAGLGAFTVARGVGRPLAERIIKAEMAGHEKEGSSGGGMGATWQSVEQAIESGGFFRQLTAVTLLRLTPVVPYSATNYLLGLTPIQPLAFLLGTVTGMSIWSVLYASLGGASRSLLEGGADLELLLVDLGEKASSYSQDIAIVALAAGGLGLVGWLIARSRAGSSGSDVGQQQSPQQQQQMQAAVDVDVRQEEVLNHK